LYLVVADSFHGEAREFDRTQEDVTLTAALVAGGIAGTMPCPTFWIVLQPLAGAALLLSGDFYLRHREIPPFEPMILPLLIASYALWARLRALQARLAARATSCVVSVISLIIAANY